MKVTLKIMAEEPKSKRPKLEPTEDDGDAKKSKILIAPKVFAVTH